MNTHKKLFLKIIKIDKNLEFINNSNNIINLLLYKIQEDKN